MKANDDKEQSKDRKATRTTVKIEVQSKNGEPSKTVEYTVEKNSMHHRFDKEFNQPLAIRERARVISGLRAATNDGVRELYHLVSLAIRDKHSHGLNENAALALNLEILAAALMQEPDSTRLADNWNLEGAIGKLLVKLMMEPDAPAKLSTLAALAGKFPPLTKQFNVERGYGVPDWFNPTLQDGLKAIMLRSFHDLMLKQTTNSLPTIRELDSIVCDEWKWQGGDKELRDARRELGLSGLPRARSGRRKQGVKK